MSATNTTTHYNLPSFVGSDKPAWLVDWNGAMAAIDSAIYEAKSTADQAVTAAAAVASDLATLSGTVSTQGSSITTLSETLTTAVGNINTINGNITTINSLIGNGTPTTTDQTIIGAINEINADVGSIHSDLTVEKMQLRYNDADAFTVIKYGEVVSIRRITASSVTVPTADTPTVIDTLPAGWRPFRTIGTPIEPSDGTKRAYMQVDANGEVSLTCSQVGYVGAFVLTFIAEQ